MNKKQLNILLADDDSDDRNFFNKALKELPISTSLTTVDDGEQLINYLSENSKVLPDVLFLDLNMPRKNGLECLSEIKQNNRLKDIPVVIFSTSSSQDMINRLFKIGAHVYVRKPSSLDQLKQLIKHALPMAAENIFTTSESVQKNKQLKYILNA